MYAGYINVNVSHGRNLFYWLVESAGSPDTDPLVLWSALHVLPPPALGPK
jgi:hypothetical protein